MGLPFHPCAKTHANEIRAQPWIAVHCRKEKVGDLPNIYNSFDLDLFPRDCV